MTSFTPLDGQELPLQGGEKVQPLYLSQFNKLFYD